MGGLAETLTEAQSFAFSEIPGFPTATVSGHAGRLWLGKLGTTPVACLQGRIHLYEGHDPTRVKTLVRTLKLLGCEALLVTNAAGSLDKAHPPGSLMLINDHINMLARNPLIGPNDEAFGPRFPPMTNAYDEALQAHIKATASRLGLTLFEGVYLATLGPNFETAAEIRAMQILGAHAVGMSTVPEVIVARHCDMRVAAISVLTNYGAGMVDETLSHAQTLHFAGEAASSLQRLVAQSVSRWNEVPA